MHNLFLWLDYFGVFVFAFSGALMAGRYKLDPFGVAVLAAVTAIGGGTVRDVILQTPVFWLTQPTYLYIILITASLTILFVRQPKRIPKRFMYVADAFGLALFAVLGTQKALDLGSSYMVAVMMGTITGVVGGMIRDLMCNVIPLILRKEIYALAAILGGSIFVLLYHLGVNENDASIIAIVCALTIRLAAIYWKVSLPAFHIEEKQDKKK